MKKHKLLLSLLLTALYDYLFWNQNMGINVLVLFILLVSAALYFNPEAIKKTSVKIVLSGTLLCALLVLLYGSTITKVCYLFSFAVLIGFIHQPELKTIYNSFLTYLLSVSQSIKNVIDLYNDSENGKLKKAFSYIPLTITPFIILIIFYWIFKFANPVFDQLSSNLWNKIWEDISQFFGNFSFLHALFILSGLLIIFSIIFNRDLQQLLKLETPLSDYFIRSKKSIAESKKYSEGFGELFIGLKNEYRIALIMTVMINTLLLIVNYIDVQWLWFNFDYSQTQNLAQFVHEGTWLLILSILFSMAIILFFFRANINLLKNNKTLKILAYVWIAQNAILATSVAMRNYHYIHQHGLAYKRIGVIVFLILVIVGLITLIVKIKDKKSSFFLFRTNSWALYFVMLLTSCLDWDMIIINNNINHPNAPGIDKEFLLTLSDKTLYVLSQNKFFFPETKYVDDKVQPYSDYIDKRVQNFIQEYPKKNWQSFNAAENNCYTKLTTKINN